MSTLAIRPQDKRTEFRPGEVLEGSVDWEVGKRDGPGGASAVELRLIWFTRGKGTADVSVEEARRFEASSASGKGKYRFVLPAAPYSFSGKLISLSWALELVDLAGDEATQWEFILAPDGREVLLPQGQGSAELAAAALPDWIKSRVPGANKKPKSALEERNPFDE